MNINSLVTDMTTLRNSQLGEHWTYSPFTRQVAGDAIETLERLNRNSEVMRAALADILNWCEIAERKTGLKPYGLDVARKALKKVDEE